MNPFTTAFDAALAKQVQFNKEKELTALLIRRAADALKDIKDGTIIVYDIPEYPNGVYVCLAPARSSNSTTLVIAYDNIQLDGVEYRTVLQLMFKEELLDYPIEDL